MGPNVTFVNKKRNLTVLYKNRGFLDRGSNYTLFYDDPANVTSRSSYTTHSMLIPLYKECPSSTDCEATHSAIFSVYLTRHLYKICDTAVHAGPPFTISTSAKIYDPSPRLSLLPSTLHFNCKRNTQLRSWDSGGMEPSKVAEKLFSVGWIFRQVQRRQQEKSNRSPSYSAPL
jgi:hypothetical protein